MKNPVGKTKNSGWQAGARKTFPVSPDRAWQWLVSAEGLQTWLGSGTISDLNPRSKFGLNDGTQGEIRVFKPGSHIRLTWQPKGWFKPSTIQVRVIPNGRKTTIAFHQENLPDAGTRGKRKEFFLKVLDRTGEMLAASKA